MTIALQNMLKIIIIGSLGDNALSLSNRHYLEDPSNAYYPVRGYYPPNPYPYHHEPEPEYYEEEEELHPERIPYEDEQEYYYPASPPHLIRYNRNYYSPQLPPPIQPPPQNRYQTVSGPSPSYLSSLRMKIEPSQENFNTLRTVLRMTEPESSKLPQSNNVLPTIVIENEENPSTYQPEEKKGYLEDEYSDNYGDEGPPAPPEAASLNYPYQYFEPVRLPDSEDDGKLIYSYPPFLRADFSEIIPVFKTPITILPSRFPPRIEKIIQRIQNYFSTYNPQVEKPIKKPDSTVATSNLQTVTDDIIGETSAPTNVAEEQTAAPEMGQTVAETIGEIETAKPTVDDTPIDASTKGKIQNGSQEEIVETTLTPFQLSPPDPMENGTRAEVNATEPDESNLSVETLQTYPDPGQRNISQGYHHYMENAISDYMQNMSPTSGFHARNSTGHAEVGNLDAMPPSSGHGQYLTVGNVSGNDATFSESTSVPEIHVRSSTDSFGNTFSAVSTPEQMPNRTPSWNGYR